MGTFARVLGIAQDAGVPHVGCTCPRCERHRTSPLLPAALGLVDGDACFLIDATPALPEQLRMLPGAPGAILLTHVHMGHVAGLLQLGPEALNAVGMPLHATPRVCEWLRDHAPWEMLVRRGHLRLFEHAPGARFALTSRLEVESVPVVHRAEYTDTVGYLVHGPRRTVLYLPDIDRWDLDLPALLARCDLALLDGTFYSSHELPRQADIPHPPIETTLDLLTPADAAKVRFTHLNHTNPVLDPEGPAALVAVPGEDIPLD